MKGKDRKTKDSDGKSQKIFGKVGLEWWKDNSDRDIWESITYKELYLPDAENEWPSPIERAEKTEF